MEPVLPRLFPAGVATAEGDPACFQNALPLEEEAAAREVSALRRRDFTAGRNCARRALEGLGHPAAPLPAGANRIPRWPAGVSGCIAHTRGYCGAAVAHRTQTCAIGLDIERCDRLQPATYRRICTDAERAWLEAQAPDRVQAWATLLFSAKECLYKCQYPLTGAYLGFRDVQLRVHAEAGEFRVESWPLDERLPWMRGLHGRFVFAGPFVFTGLWAPAG